MTYADHLHFAWWLDGEGHPWVRHACVEGRIEEYRVPPPWTFDVETGALTPSFNCHACDRHTFLLAVDRIDAPGEAE